VAIVGVVGVLGIGYGLDWIGSEKEAWVVIPE
jgi:hypothetical protein